MTFSVTLPLKTVSLTNAREHWGTRMRRSRAERDAVGWTVPRGKPPCTVTLTRIAPKRYRLDDDNLRGALKSVRDGVAARLGADDADPRIKWEYGQEDGEYGVRIDIAGARGVRRRTA